MLPLESYKPEPRPKRPWWDRAAPGAFVVLCACIMWWLAWEAQRQPPPSRAATTSLEVVRVPTDMPQWPDPPRDRLYVTVELDGRSPASCVHPGVTEGWSTDPSQFRLVEVQALSPERLLCVWDAPKGFVP